MQNPTHVYASCDSFLVELIVVDIHGCNDTIENTVVVHCLPEITSLNISNGGICDEDTITFFTSYTSGDGQIYKLILYYGDGDSTLSLTNIIDSISHAFDTCNINGISYCHIYYFRRKLLL